MPDKYVVRPLPYPVYGMTHGVVVEGAKHNIALAATERFAEIVALALTQACAIAAADRAATESRLRGYEREWLETHGRDLEMRVGRDS